jgi:hypothetical protein
VHAADAASADRAATTLARAYHFADAEPAVLPLVAHQIIG